MSYQHLHVQAVCLHIYTHSDKHTVRIKSVLFCNTLISFYRPDSKLRYPVPLKDYHIPFQLRLGLNQGKPSEELSALLEQELGLQMPQYPQKFASLLHIEELQMEVDIRHYDMEDMILTPEGQFLVLKVWIS